MSQFHLCNGSSYTGKMTYWYLDSPLFLELYPLIYIYSYRIRYRSEENQSYICVEVLRKCTSRSTYRDYDKRYDVDRFTSKFVRHHIPKRVPEHPTNSEDHHGHLREKPAITYKIPLAMMMNRKAHDDVIKWKHFPRNWPFVRGLHRSRWIPLTKASDVELWCFFFICVKINSCVNNHEASYLRRHRGHYDVNVMITS